MLFLFGCTVINLLILMHDPLPALLGLASCAVRRSHSTLFLLHTRGSCDDRHRTNAYLKGLITMPHIQLPEGLHGIRGAMAFRPDTAKPLNELVEVLLRGPNSLTPGERELIATYVSSENDCYYCQTIHGAHRSRPA